MTKHVSYGAVLPHDEMVRLISKHRGVVGRGKSRDTFSRGDLCEYGLGRDRNSKSLLIMIEKGEYRGPMLLARLSRFLVLIEMGLVSKKDGKVTFLKEPEGRPREIVFKVNLDNPGKVFQFVQPKYQIGNL